MTRTAVDGASSTASTTGVIMNLVVLFASLRPVVGVLTIAEEGTGSGHDGRRCNRIDETPASAKSSTSVVMRNRKEADLQC